MIQTAAQPRPSRATGTLAGGLFWLLSVQYFVIQAAAAHWYRPGYSLRFNTISDLGNTACGPYRHMTVCSPQHAAMNVSFVILGLTMLCGAVLLYRSVHRHFVRTLGLAGIALSGLGSILVGLFPENTVSACHITGAALVFSFGNIALLLLGVTLQMPRPLRRYTVLSGTLGLIALLLFLTHHYMGLGIGGMERLTAYPQTIWLTVYGGYLLLRGTSKRPQHRILSDKEH